MTVVFLFPGNVFPIICLDKQLVSLINNSAARDSGAVCIKLWHTLADALTKQEILGALALTKGHCKIPGCLLKNCHLNFCVSAVRNWLSTGKTKTKTFLFFPDALFFWNLLRLSEYHILQNSPDSRLIELFFFKLCAWFFFYLAKRNILSAWQVKRGNNKQPHHWKRNCTLRPNYLC